MQRRVINWHTFNYRARHDMVPLLPEMLGDGLVKELDSRLVLFDKNYIVWRILLLLSRITKNNKQDSIEVLEQALCHLKAENQPMALTEQIEQSTQL